MTSTTTKNLDPARVLAGLDRDDLTGPAAELLDDVVREALWRAGGLDDDGEPTEKAKRPIARRAIEARCDDWSRHGKWSPLSEQIRAVALGILEAA